MKHLLIALFFGLAFNARAQNSRALIRSGNQAYELGAFDDAEVAYSEALRADANSAKARFNLGDALFRQERLEDALAEFQAAAELSEDPALKAKSFHNMGNIHGAAQQWDQAVEAYKQSLRANPMDEETRHNLAYAQQQLKQQQEQQEQNKDENQQDQNQDQQNDQEQDQEQNQDQQNQEDQQQQDQDQQNQNQQQEDQQNEQGEDENEQQPDPEQQGQQPAEGQISREEAMRLLEALQQQEQQVQEKLKKAKVKAKKTKKEKDW